MQITKKIIIKGKIKALTGLMVGGSNNAMGIGGADKVVVRNPITNEPYIPGSSLKGKMRSLLELSFGYVIDNETSDSKKVRFEPSNDPTKHVTALLFGNANTDKGQRPSRLIVRDASLTKESVEKLDKEANVDLPFTEAKTEVVIDRITAVASPRTFERVPAGVEFNLNLVLNIIDVDTEDFGFKESDLLDKTFQSLQLLQDDYLGGSGSRGYGQVSFKIEEVIIRPKEFYLGDKEKEEKHNETEVLEKLQIPKALLMHE